MGGTTLQVETELTKLVLKVFLWEATAILPRMAWERRLGDSNGGQPGRTKSPNPVVNMWSTSMFIIYFAIENHNEHIICHSSWHGFFSAQNDDDIFSRRRFPGGGGLTTSQGGWRVRRQGANFRSSQGVRISAPKKWCLCGCRTWINHEK